MNCPSPTVLPWIQALFLPGIGAILTATGIWVAVQQMRLARLKTQHDLFDRRFAIYQATLDLFGSISATGRVLPINRDNFQQERLKADFILSSDLASYLRDEVWEHMMKLENASRRAARDGPDREQALDAEGIETGWFHAEMPKLRLRFRREMKLIK